MTSKLTHPPSINPWTLFSWGSDIQQLKTELKMCSRLMFCLSLLLCGLLGECVGIALVPKDKRGWTLNSAGYLLGPHAHQTLSDKGGLAGKREAMEDVYSLGQDSLARVVLPSDDSILQILMDFLSYLHLRDQGSVSRLPFPLSEETMQQK